MKLHVAMFYHSLVSDWNHGNAHFLRGIAAELQARGHDVSIFEPEDGWSRENLLREAGQQATDDFAKTFPSLQSFLYRPEALYLDRWLDSADLVLVHEWNEPSLISALGRYRRSRNDLRILFHDTHHRAVTAPEELARFDLSAYDGVLAYGASLKGAYQRHGWGSQVHTWHEAADTRVFYPRETARKEGDLVWIGNWGDEERSEEIRQFFIGPVKENRWNAHVRGVRYPQAALSELAAAGISYGGWIPNFKVPELFAQYRATVHVPRRPYTVQLPGIPTIRPFEALACGIPLVSAPWPDTEGLFRSGHDFLMARDGSEMTKHVRNLLEDAGLRQHLADAGLETIRQRHTCGHRVDELFSIYDAMKPASKWHTESLPEVSV